MTKALKVKILAVLLTVLLAMGGLFLANTTRVNASSISTSGSNTLEVTSFVMREGASIRLGNGSEEQMGIKFVAELSNSEYQALRVDFKNVQYGVFIMPKAYATEFGEINYDNCFGENKIYYAPNETVIEGGYKIHNIKTVPKYVEENDYNGYIVQGSIINMLDENLNVELIGVPYIIAEKDGQPYYAFAQNAHDNVRTVVQVAQNLLDKNGYNAEDPVDAVKQGYVTRFLSNYETENDETFKTSYNAEFYLMNSQGEYVLDASKTTTVENVEMSSAIVAQTVAANNAPAHDGYLALTGLNGAFNDANEFVYDSKLLKVDGSTTLKFIYQEDKGNIFFNTSMINGNFGWSSPTVGTISDAWSMSGDSSLFFETAAEPQLYYGTGLSSTASKDTDGNYIYGQENTGRNGWKLSNVYFPTTTSKISFWYVNLGNKNGSIQLTFNAANDGLDKTTKYTRSLGATKTPRKVEIDVGKEIGSINHMIIYCTANVYLDNMAWEKDLYVEQKLVTASSATSANLGNLKANVKSTKYTASELANVEVSNVVATAISSGTTAVANDGVLEASNGSYTLAVEAKGYYEYTATYTLGSVSTTGKGFVKAASGIYGFASFAKYTNGGVWYDGMEGTYSGYLQDQTAAENGLLHMSSYDLNYKTNGVINGSIYKMGIDDGYSLRVYPGPTSWSSSKLFYFKYYRRWQSGYSAATSMSFPQANNNTMVCFFVYNPTAQVINMDGLYNHYYLSATVVDAGGTAISAVNRTFGLGELQPGWNYVEHDFVAANAENGAVNLTGLATRLEYNAGTFVNSEGKTTTITCYYVPTMLFDSYAVR